MFEEILVNDQPDAQFLSICLFYFSTCFEQPRDQHQENQLYQYNIWYMSLCLSDRLVCRSRSPTQSYIYQMLYWYNWFSWWWARGCSKHVEKLNKHTGKNCASIWSFTRNYTKMRGQQNIKKKIRKKSSGLTSRIALMRTFDVDDKPRFSSTTRNFLNSSAPSMTTWSTNDADGPTYSGMRGLRFSEHRLLRHVTPRSPVQAHRRFGVFCCFYNQDRWIKDKKLCICRSCSQASL